MIRRCGDDGTAARPQKLQIRAHPRQFVHAMRTNPQLLERDHAISSSRVRFRMRRYDFVHLARPNVRFHIEKGSDRANPDARHPAFPAARLDWNPLWLLLVL